MTALNDAPATGNTRNTRTLTPDAHGSAATAAADSGSGSGSGPAPGRPAAVRRARSAADAATAGPGSGSARSASVRRARSVAPGAALALGVAAVATVIGQYVPLVGSAVPGAVIGALIALTRKPGSRLAPGLKWSSTFVLQCSVVLLGAQLSIAEAARVGVSSLPVMLGTLAACLGAAWLYGRLLGVPRDLRTLIGVGTGICGGSAIAAVSPVIEAASTDVAYAISTIFLFNIAAVLAFPLLGHALGMSQQSFGLFAGTAVNDTSSVVATATTYGAAATSHAVVVKLVRTLMIIPVCLTLAALTGRNRKPAHPAPSPRLPAPSRRLPAVSGRLPALSRPLPAPPQPASAAPARPHAAAAPAPLIAPPAPPAPPAPLAPLAPSAPAASPALVSSPAPAVSPSPISPPAPAVSPTPAVSPAPVSPPASAAAAPPAQARMSPVRILRLVPWFLIGFVLVAAVNSAGAIPAAAHGPLQHASVFLVAVALSAIGLSTNVPALRKAGHRPLLLGALLWITVTAASLGLQALTGTI